MATNLDLLGFTKQTETLLCGIGAHNLIKEFKRRNISTNVLHKLTKKDFIQLGADEHQAENIVNAVCCISKKKTSHVETKPHHSTAQMEILQQGDKQLEIIQVFVKYCRMKLRKERINFFVEPDKALSASQILCIAADATLKEVNKAELKFKELEAEWLKKKSESLEAVPVPRRQPIFVTYIPFCGLCIATYILLDRLWRVL